VKGAGRWLIPILPVPVIGLLAFGLTRDVQVLPSAIVGEPAPDFHLATMSGDSLALEDLAGEIVILNFWASWCIPCRQEHPALVRATETYDPGKVRVLGVLYQDEPSKAKRFMDRFGGEWETVLDPGTRTAIDFGVYGVPETFFLNADGQIAYKHIGPLNWGIIEAKVDSILAVEGATAS
jgi:cytochrome c biogenesis protein CcmG/thiol:disulfide interchange protein DsbE